ncbi:Tn3 family transposase [Teredinibacter turnerae]|uniref:Tn3 family transposase n=1 Tax=Teredinibacter turnerae TaxID=2426 RepID=UPI00039BABF0|nr:Tn3 family transposase [Teredinibacter turnerae]
MVTEAYIINKARQRNFDNPPDLNISRNSGYVAVDAQTIQFIKNMPPINKVGYVLQKAYFHAKGRFFSPNQFKSKHVRLVEACLGFKRKVDIREYAYSTMKAHQNKILDQFGWEKTSASFIESLTLRAETLAENNPLKQDILFKLVEYCWESKVVIPQYSKLAAITNAACANYEYRLEQEVTNALSVEQQISLQAIFHEEILSDDFAALCKINESRNQHKLSKNANILATFKQWFGECAEAHARLDLPMSTIEYYAGIVESSNKSQLKRISNNAQKTLLALCFIVHNYRKRVDCSIDAFIKDLRSEKSASKKFDREANARSRERLAEEESLFIGSLENATKTVRLILNVSQNENVSLFERNEKVKQLASACLKGDSEDALESLETLRQEIENTKTKKHRYAYLFGRGQSLTRKYNSYLHIWEFDQDKSNKQILEAIHYLKEATQFCLDDCPTNFLCENEKSMLLSDNDYPYITKYRVLLFCKMEESIRNKSLLLAHSYRHKDPRSLFISDEKWKKERLDLCRRAGIENRMDADSCLNELRDSIYTLYDKLNQEIKDKTNTDVYPHPKGGWRFDLPAPDFSTEKFIPNLLGNSDGYITLLNVLREIDSFSGFSDSFANMRMSGGKTQPENIQLFATLYSLGSNLGHNETVKMANGLVSLKQLRDTENGFFSIKSLKNVNKCIIEFIHSLNLPLVYVDNDRVVNTSSDGAKLVVNVDSLLANYSFKYYGKESGINVNNFVDPKQISFNVNILSSSDREAPFLLDGLLESCEKLWDLYSPDSHTEDESDLEHIHHSDSHGYTEAVFSALWFKNILLQPHIAKVWQKKLFAYDKQTLNLSREGLVQASSAVNQGKIKKHWDEMLRIMCSVILGYCPAHLVFRQLSAGQAFHPVYHAFQELGRLVRTRATLRYLSSPELRRDVRKYLNRVELGQKFGRAVFHGREGKLQVGAPDEIHKAVLCKTICMNSTIAWNYLKLSDYYNGLKSDNERLEASEMIRSGTVMSHAHINMGGSLFLDEELPRSFKSTLDEMRNIKIMTPLNDPALE